jgi:hypothetical protein
VNREERLRRELPDDLKHRAGELAGLPVAQVDLIIGAMRLSRREGRAIETEARKRRREGRGGPSAGAVDRLALRAARRVNLDAFTGLVTHYDQGPVVLQLAVDGLRSTKPAPCSWAQIGEALGTTRQSAWERFGRQGDPDTGSARTGGVSPTEDAA